MLCVLGVDSTGQGDTTYQGLHRRFALGVVLFPALSTVPLSWYLEVDHFSLDAYASHTERVDHTSIIQHLPHGTHYAVQVIQGFRLVFRFVCVVISRFYPL